MDKTIKLIRDLTEASGVSGYETPVTRITKEYLQQLEQLTTF